MHIVNMMFHQGKRPWCVEGGGEGEKKTNTFGKMLGMKIQCCAGAAVTDLPLFLQNIQGRGAYFSGRSV